MKNYFKENWMLFKAWLVWYEHLKWDMSITTQSANSKASDMIEEVDLVRVLSVVEDLDK